MLAPEQTFADTGLITAHIEARRVPRNSFWKRCPDPVELPPRRDGCWTKWLTLLSSDINANIECTTIVSLLYGEPRTGSDQRCTSMTPSSQLSQHTQALLYQWSVKQVKPRVCRLRLWYLTHALCRCVCGLSQHVSYHVVLCQLNCQASQIAINQSINHFRDS